MDLDGFGSTRLSLTGRADGLHELTIRQDFPSRRVTPVFIGNVNVDCAAGAPGVSGVEVHLDVACRRGPDQLAGAAVLGSVTAQFVNQTGNAKPYVLEVEGQSNRSTTAAAFGSAIRRVNGLADGDYAVRVRSRGRRFYEETVSVRCSEPPGDPVGTFFEPLEGFASLDIGIGPDGLPFVALGPTTDQRSGSPIVVACGDPGCAGDNNLRTVLQGRTFGAAEFMAIAFAPSGNPVVAYFESPGPNPEDEFRDYGLALLICSDPRCVDFVIRYLGPVARGWIDPAPLASGMSVAFNPQGHPVISYWGGPDTFGAPIPLNVASCVDTTCTEATISTIGEWSGGEGFTHLSIGPDGNPTVVVSDQVVACHDPACTGEASVTGAVTGRQFRAAAQGVDGLPVVLQAQLLNADELELEQARYAYSVIDCGDPACTPENAGVAPLADVPADAQELTMTVGPGGNVVIDYTAVRVEPELFGALVLVSCDDSSCAEPTTVVLDDYVTAVVAVAPDGRPTLLANTTYETLLHVVHCATPTCE